MEAAGGRGQDRHQAVREPRHVARRQCVRPLLRAPKITLFCSWKNTERSGSMGLSLRAFIML